MSRLYNVLNALVNRTQPIDFTNGTSVTATSASSPFTCPSDGCIRLFCSYRSASYARLIQATSGETVTQFSAPSTVNLQGNNIVTYRVNKGEKYYIELGNTYCSATFYPTA